MGDPKKIVKSYTPPNHPWIRAEIEQSKELKQEFGVKNRTEILKMAAVLKHFTSQAKNLAIASGKQAELEKKQLFASLHRLGLITGEVKLESVLELTIKDVMNRRLQTILAKKGLARSTSQARQFIVHEHVTVNKKIVTAPSYLVPLADEQTIAFVESSTLANNEHPERVLIKKKEKIRPPQDKRGDKRGFKKFDRKERRKPGA